MLVYLCIDMFRKATAAALHDPALAAIYAHHLVCLADGRVDAAGPVAEELTAARLVRV